MVKITANQKTLQKRLVIPGLFLAAVLGLLLFLTVPAGAETLSYILQAGFWTSTTDKKGFDRLSLDGFHLRGAPGNPFLPVKEYRILLPPDADFSTVSVTVVRLDRELLPGSFEIRPAAPVSTYRDGRLIEHWDGDKNIVDGRNMDIYGADALFPAQVIQRAPNAEMRKYRFIRVEFHPIQYNPMTKQLTYTSTAVIAIDFQRIPQRLSPGGLEDRVLDEEAPELFYNYEDARPWYTPPTRTGPQSSDMSFYDMVIITTHAIRNGSSKFDAFVASKRELGMRVWVITEDDYDNYSGIQRADRIRNWLKGNYSAYSIEYVLLIGDPTPGQTGAAAVPMKTCLPGIDYSTSPPTYDYTPTDMYYADLSGDWDGDSNGTYGEWNDYYYYADPDLYTEVKVGRIPVYNKNYTNLDSILQKIMDYQNITDSIAWRKSALLPMSFSEAGYDGAPLAEQLWDDCLSSEGFSQYRMYQQGNGPCGDESIYISDWELRGNRVHNHWKDHDYGIVCWWGHGSATDTDIGYYGCWDGTLFSSAQCADLDNSHPAVVFQNSCNNGYPETSNNLGYSLLLNGAIGTYSASRSSWFSSGVGYGDFDGNASDGGIAYEVTRRVADNQLLGDALSNGKQAVIGSIGGYYEYLMNQYDFNLYGDPSVTLNEPDQEYHGLPWLLLLLDE